MSDIGFDLDESDRRHRRHRRKRSGLGCLAVIIALGVLVGGAASVFVGLGLRSLFGLRSELERALADRPCSATRFRCEVNQQYTTRYQELLMLHVADHGALPIVNRGDPPARLGRLSPL